MPDSQNSPPRLFIIARFHSIAGKQVELEAVLHSMVEPTRAEPGCEFLHQFQSTRDPLLFFIHSGWRSEADFELHAELPHTVRFLDLVPALIDHPLEVHRLRGLA